MPGLPSVRRASAEAGRRDATVDVERRTVHAGASHLSRDYREAYGRPPAEDATGARKAFAAAG
ncbi:hypothetical protein DEJ32_14395 [Curtobacterium sp. MCPF17_046]|nr:hypothetical protein DEJ32_14395 [Curtobacterium sp. MCPF17_046]